MGFNSGLKGLRYNLFVRQCVCSVILPFLHTSSLEQGALSSWSVGYPHWSVRLAAVLSECNAIYGVCMRVRACYWELRVLVMDANEMQHFILSASLSSGPPKRPLYCLPEHAAVDGTAVPCVTKMSVLCARVRLNPLKDSKQPRIPHFRHAVCLCERLRYTEL